MTRGNTMTRADSLTPLSGGPKPVASSVTSSATSAAARTSKPSFTHGGILYTISRHKLGMTHETASRFVDACVRFAADDTDHAPEAA